MMVKNLEFFPDNVFKYEKLKFLDALNLAEESRSITCEKFYNTLRQGNVLVLDVRPEEEFDKCRVKCDLCVNVSPNLLDAE